MAFWNTADLLQPPENTCKVKISLNDYTNLGKIFLKASETFRELGRLNYEAALLSRIIYRSKTKFRTDKAFHKLEAVNRGLLKYLALDIVSIYNTFETFLPKNEQLQGRILITQNEIALPSRQMLEWILVRTQGFARLFCYVIYSCEEAFASWLGVIKRGMLWDASSLMVAILGRIWTMSKYLAVHACDWYSELLPYHDILKPVGMNWLPPGYKLPTDLKLWLNMPHIFDCKTNELDASKSEMSDVLKLLGMSKETDSMLPTDNSTPSSITTNIDHANVDLGVSVSREEILQQMEMSKKNKKNIKGENVPVTDAALMNKSDKKAKKLNKRLAATYSVTKIDSAGKKKKKLKELLAAGSVNTTNVLGKKKKMKDLPAVTDLLAAGSVNSTNILGKKKKMKDLPVVTDLLAAGSVNSTNILGKKKKMKDLPAVTNLLAAGSVNTTKILGKKKKTKDLPAVTDLLAACSGKKTHILGKKKKRKNVPVVTES